jgi:hypothetical protein
LISRVQTTATRLQAEDMCPSRSRYEVSCDLPVRIGLRSGAGSGVNFTVVAMQAYQEFLSQNQTGVIMKRTHFSVAIALLAISSASMAAHHEKSDMGMEKMKMMDTNGDGMISKDEFMKAHEAMYAQMKKNHAGMVDIKEMHMMMQKKMDSKHKDMPMGQHDKMKGEGMHK